MKAVLVSMLLFLCPLPSAAAEQPTGAAGAAMELPRPPCLVTRPNDVTKPDPAMAFGAGNGDYGNDALWTSLWIWGEHGVAVPPDHVGSDGSLGSMKWAWYRFIPGRLTIEGVRLDGPAPPLRADIPDGYGDRGFQVSGLTFPTAGCWQITGRLGQASLTFVTWVYRIDATGAPLPTR